MQQYKKYPIDGHAVPRGARNDSGWEAVGAVFEPELFETKSVCREVKRFRSGRELFFESKQEAEAFGLLLCRAWIDGLPE